MTHWVFPKIPSEEISTASARGIWLSVPMVAKAIRDARLPEDDHSDTCSMCGKFCAVRSMNKALAGEYIDIL